MKKLFSIFAALIILSSLFAEENLSFAEEPMEEEVVEDEFFLELLKTALCRNSHHSISRKQKKKHLNA